MKKPTIKPVLKLREWIHTAEFAREFNKLSQNMKRLVQANIRNRLAVERWHQRKRAGG